MSLTDDLSGVVLVVERLFVLVEQLRDLRIAWDISVDRKRV